MDDHIRKLIEEQYGLAIESLVEAPRQFVAETFILNCSDIRYFCKIVDKPLFIPPIIESLPVINELYKKGLERLNYPIPTRKGELYLQKDGSLIVLFNYIDAEQSEDYDFYSFGRLISTLHSATSKIDVTTAKEDFDYRYAESFEKQLNNIVESDSADRITQSLRTLLIKYLDEVRHDYANFLDLSQQLKAGEHKMVITHGDPGGNTLVKSPTDLYLIDWDNILLAPPERDTWFFQHESEFIRGYQSINSNYQIDHRLSHFFTYNRYFEDLVEYFAEILGTGTEVYRKKNLAGLEEDCLEGWLRPSIRQFDPYS
jgi:hypothetical protein